MYGMEVSFKVSALKIKYLLVGWLLFLFCMYINTIDIL